MMSKILAVGDIHTKSWIIHEVVKLIDNYDGIVFVGDYADNWNTSPAKSINTWRLLKNFIGVYPNKVHAVVGNHDYAYIHPEIAGRSSGFNHTTFTLLNSPENKHIKDWLLALPIFIELDGVTFSHAGITEEWSGEDDVQSLWRDDSPIWARPKEYGGHVKYKNIKQVIGHNPSNEIWRPAPNVWCIDTFSETQKNKPIGNQTALEIVDGAIFKPIDIRITYEHNSSTADIENILS